MDRADHLPIDATDPAERKARVALRAALALLVPLARWLVHNGVPYSSFAPALKSVFVEAARRELADSGGKQTDSALSVLSGVHRRDIRALADDAHTQAQPKAPSVASQVFTRWLTDGELRDKADRPIALPKSGPAPSFEALARQVSSDVHPRTLLAEMLRLELVRVDDDTVHLLAHAFVPQHGFDEMAELFAANAADHLAAAVHNLRSEGDDKMLEQSMFASGLSPRSTQALGVLARRLWRGALQQMVREATPRYQHDQRAEQGTMRMRFGVYYYSEPLLDGSAPSAGAAASAPARDTRTPRGRAPRASAPARKATRPGKPARTPR